MMNIRIETSDPSAISPTKIAATLRAEGYIVLSVTVTGYPDGYEDVWSLPEPNAASDEIEADRGEITRRLAAIRESIVAEEASWGEIIELQSLTDHIDRSDSLLLEWAGVPEVIT